MNMRRGFLTSSVEHLTLHNVPDLLSWISAHPNLTKLRSLSMDEFPNMPALWAKLDGLESLQLMGPPEPDAKDNFLLFLNNSTHLTKLHLRNCQSVLGNDFKIAVDNKTSLRLTLSRDRRRGRTHR